jgi:hypothetical protein
VSKTSPTSRSLAMLKDDGYLCAIVEKWNPHARIRQDLFGVIDILAIRDGETLAVQTTTASNAAARAQKIAEAEATPIMRKANWRIHIHGWRKSAAGVWVCNVEDVS